LASRRVRMAQQGHLPIRAAAKAIYDTLQTLRAGNVPVEADLAPPALMRHLLREDDYERGAKNFM
jgi:oxaloacetate decarboxylase